MLIKKLSPALLCLSLLALTSSSISRSEMVEEDEDEFFCCDEEQCEMQDAQNSPCSLMSEEEQEPAVAPKRECYYADLAIAAYKQKAHELPGIAVKFEHEILKDYPKEALPALLTYNAEYAEKMHAVIMKSAPHIYATSMLQATRDAQNQLMSGVFSMLADAVVWHAVAHEFRAMAQDIKLELSPA